MRAGGAGVELALAFENRQMLGLDGAANGGNQNRRMIAGVGAGDFQRGQQRR